MGTTSTTLPGIVVGVFYDPLQAQRAVSDLHAAGYTTDQIGVVSPNRDGTANVANGASGSNLDAGIATGMAAGAGAGALWGLAILAGVLPGIGPAIAGGTLGMLLSSAAAGAAAAAGLGVGLASLGIPDEDANYYEGEFKAGRTIVTVHGNQNPQNAQRILSQCGGYSRLSKSGVK